MISLRTAARPSVVSGLLAALACGLAAGDVRAVPIPTHITYSTTGPEPLKTAAGDVVFEFQPVTDGVATPGKELRLGTILIHKASPGKGFSFDNAVLPLSLSINAVNGEPVLDSNATVSFSNLLSANVYEDGKVMGGLSTFHEFNGVDILRAGGMTLSLKPIETAPLWNISNDSSVAAVDVFARLEGTPVPEPSVLLIFAAAGIGWKRLKGLKRSCGC